MKYHLSARIPGLALLCLTAWTMAYCTPIVDPPPPATPTAPATEAPASPIPPTDVDTLAPTDTLPPTAIATVTDEPTATSTTTPDFSSTPTQITPDGSIIEVTPLGGNPATPVVGMILESIEREFIPVYGLRVRSRLADELPSTALPVTTQLYNNVVTYAQITVYPQGDVWLCLDKPPALYVDSSCAQVTAYLVGGTTYGSLVY